MFEHSPASVCNQGFYCFALFLNAFLLLSAHCNQGFYCFALCLNTLLLLCAHYVCNQGFYCFALCLNTLLLSCLFTFLFSLIQPFFLITPPSVGDCSVWFSYVLQLVTLKLDCTALCLIHSVFCVITLVCN